MFLTGYDVVAWIFIVIDIALLFGFVYALEKSWKFRPVYHKGPGKYADHRETMHDVVMKERWHAIMAKFATGTPEAARLAIIDADALVDTALKGMKIEGEHLADRLSNLETEDIPSMTRIWRAHRTRNDLVHTSGFTISPQDAERTMHDYEAFLKDIKVVEGDRPSTVKLR